MPKKIITKLSSVLFILQITNVSAQIGINTSNPKGVFHLDGKIDNKSNISDTQALNDFIITEKGDIGIGTITPGNKIEINSGSHDNNTLRFTKLNSTTQTEGDIKAIGVDKNGDVVLMERPALNVLPGNCTQPYALVKGLENRGAVRVSDDYIISKDFYLDPNYSIAGTQRNISFNPTTGIFKLKAGNTYKLEASLLVEGTNGYIQSRWQINPNNNATSRYIGNMPRSSIFIGDNPRDGDQGRSMAIYTAKFDTEVALKVSSMIYTEYYYPKNSYAVITQINPCKIQPEL